MKKKKLKNIIEELEVELEAAKMGREMAEDKAEAYRKRFEEFGTNVETIEDINGVKMLKWTMMPRPWGAYAAYSQDMPINKDEIKKTLAYRIANGLIENNVVQFIDKPADPEDPIGNVSTLGAKLYVIPWDKVPHSRTLELRQRVAEIIKEVGKHEAH